MEILQKRGNYSAKSILKPIVPLVSRKNAVILVFSVKNALKRGSILSCFLVILKEINLMAFTKEKGKISMSDRCTLRGLTTVSFYAADLAAARKWYAELLGLDPYFEVPGYIEFRLGDYQHELGVIDSRYAPAGEAHSPAGAVVYWHVDDVRATLEKLLSLGAKEHQALTDRGEGFVTASVVDPFGNILGIMYNRHYLQVLDSARKV